MPQASPRLKRLFAEHEQHTDAQLRAIIVGAEAVLAERRRRTVYMLLRSSLVRHDILQAMMTGGAYRRRLRAAGLYPRHVVDARSVQLSPGGRRLVLSSGHVSLDPRGSGLAPWAYAFDRAGNLHERRTLGWVRVHARSEDAPPRAPDLYRWGFLDAGTLLSALDDAVDAWHRRVVPIGRLHEHLGLTFKEYETFVVAPKRLPAMLDRRMRRLARAWLDRRYPEPSPPPPPRLILMPRSW